MPTGFPVRRIFWLACGVVAVSSLVPVAHLPPIAFDLWDKAQHALAFALLAALGLAGYRTHPTRVVLGLLLFGAAIELTQGWTGLREADLLDWLADTMGVAAVGLAGALRRSLFAVGGHARKDRATD